jgi:hypothetical protein
LCESQLHREIIGAAETTDTDSLAFELCGSSDACAGHESIGQSIVDPADNPSLCAFKIGNDEGRAACAKKIQALADQRLHGQGPAGDEYDFYIQLALFENAGILGDAEQHRFCASRRIGADLQGGQLGW